MNSCALITGASRGIGLETARIFAAHHYNLILTCKHNMNKLLLLKEELENNFHVQCKCVSCDMGNYDEVKKLFDEITNLSVVINNAGISHVGLLQDMTKEEWNEIINTNLSSVFYTSKFAIPFMLHKEGGQIINISSIWGNVGASTEVAYSASKGGVNAFTKALAKELAPSNIKVNAVAFGFIETQMNEHLSKEETESLFEEIPMGRGGSTKEASEMIYQLASSPAYLTGQIITMDGGWI